jgi:hypothetical protein
MMLGHTYSMKKVAAVVILTTIALSTPSTIALADPTPAPSTTQLSPLEQYRVDRDLYLNSMKLRQQEINQINAAFNKTCTKVKKDYKNAILMAKTPDQKNQAVATRDAAISAAILAHESAMNKLGSEPTPPAEPMRLQKMQGKSKVR